MLLAPYGAGLRLSRLPTKHFDTYVKPSWKRRTLLIRIMYHYKRASRCSHTPTPWWLT